MRARAVLVGMAARWAVIAVMATPSGVAAQRSGIIGGGPGSGAPGVAATLQSLGLTALGDAYLGNVTGKLDAAETDFLKALQDQVKALEDKPDSILPAIDAIVSQLTLMLATGQSPNAVTAASAFLVKLEPRNPRVTNLFGSVLHANGRLRHAEQVLDLAARQAPKGYLAQMNLASVLLDEGKDARAKRLLDSIVARDPQNQKAWRAIALYWYKQGNKDEHRRALLRGSQFAGLFRRKSARNDATVSANDVDGTDDLAAVERKVRALAALKPLTAADIIEDQDPVLAGKVRREALTPPARQLWTLPAFPQVNTQDIRGYTESVPVIMEWVREFAEHYGGDAAAEMLAKSGITLADTEAEIEAKARALAQKELEKGLNTAQQQLKAMQGMLPPSARGELATATSGVKQAAREHGVKLTDAPVTDTARVLGFDTGAPFARANYRNYQVTMRAYERWLERYFLKFEGEEKEWMRQYSVKAQAELELHARQMDAARTSADPAAQDRERLRFARAMNTLGNEYFQLWVNLYVPDYMQKMRPMLEGYAATAVLYIRNMVDPEVAAREYFRVRAIYGRYAMKAGTYAADGAQFAHIAATDDEMAALEAAIRAAEVEAETKRPVFLLAHKRDTLPHFKVRPARNPEWYEYLNGDSELEFSGQFLSYKISRQKFEFRAWAFGPLAGFKWDAATAKVATYYGLSAQFAMGTRFGNLGVNASASADYIAQVTTFDLVNGTVEEAFPNEFSVNASAKGASVIGSTPVFDASASVKYNTTGASANFKVASGGTTLTGSASSGRGGPNMNVILKEGWGPFSAKGEISYTPKGGLTGSASVGGGVGPVSASAGSTVNSNTGVTTTAQIGTSAGPATATRTYTYNSAGLTAKNDLTFDPPKTGFPQVDAELIPKLTATLDVPGAVAKALKDLSLPIP